MIPLQSGVSPLTDGDIFRTVVDVYTANGVPVPVVAFMLFGSIGAAYYLVQQRVIIPLVMLAIIGGVTIARAPTTLLQGLAAAMLIALAGLAYLIINRIRVK